MKDMATYDATNAAWFCKTGSCADCNGFFLPEAYIRTVGYDRAFLEMFEHYAESHPMLEFKHLSP